MGNYFRFYRLLYSFFATASLTIILWYLFSLKSLMLWNAGYFEKGFSIISIGFGLTIMLICIKKYFVYLSGVDVFIKTKSENHLQVKGLHKFVRHPLYAGTLVFLWGLFLFNPLVSWFISAICITIYTRIGIYFEEKKLIAEFGESYKEFASSTPMLIPRLF